MKKNIVIISAMALISACSTSSYKISATYVSPLQYQAYDCDQITVETHRINDRVNLLGARLDEAATNDIILVGVGVIFWPALFAIGGTNIQEFEYAHQKGAYSAVENAAIAKGCPKVIVTKPVSMEIREDMKNLTPAGF